MSEVLVTKLKINSWDEEPYRELADGAKLSRAEVRLSGIGGELESGSFDALLFYQADGTSTYVTLMEITGTLDGRSGSFVLQGRGSHDGTTARVESSIVPGSGTDGLTGITGQAESVSTHADYPFMPIRLKYDLG
jgi:hypothetical protein